MELIHPLAEKYAEKFSSQEDDLLKSITAETVQSHAEPHMMSGHLQGQFLEIISKIIQPKCVLEIGTMIGYSTICLAKGLAAGGLLHTIEKREQDAAAAQQNFERAGLSGKIKLHTGVAADIIQQLDEIWDLVFIDADKPSYGRYYELVKPRLRKGGIILADNVLFHGDVLHEQIKGKNGKAMHAFNEMIAADDEVEKVMLTLRDGLTIIRKK